MARSVKEEEHAEKRNAILDVALRLVYTRGYEQMTIQDMLDELKISKGAFYHYFASKQAVLEALIERLQGDVERLLDPIVNDPDLGALAKLQRFFPSISRWKTQRKAFMLSLMRVLYADENAIFRQKAFDATIKTGAPPLAKIIQQGIQEGIFLTVAYPEPTGELIMSLILNLGDTTARLLLSSESGSGDFARAEHTVTTYTDALERTLGIPSGSLSLIDSQLLQEWFVAPEEHA